MGRKKARRKPQRAIKDPVRYALESVRPPAPKFVDRLRLQELGALEAFTHGRGDFEQWQVLARMTNTSEYLGEHGCGLEAVPAAQRAAAGLMNAVERGKAGGGWGLDGPALQALREVREFMDLQFQSLTVKELEAHFAGIRREQERLRRLAA